MSEGHSAQRRGVRVGIDVGAVRVGVATSDPDALVATPVRTLQRSARNDRVDDVAAIVAETAAIGVVVGLPRSMSGAEGPAAASARDYAEKVAAAVQPVPVHLVDERLSTVSAHQQLHQAGRSGRQHREVVDQVAAVLILQAALDQEKRSGTPAGDEVIVAHDDAGTKESGT